MSNPNMKVLIVGAPDSVGAELAAKLAEQGIESDVVERTEDILKKELGQDWGRGMVSELTRMLQEQDLFDFPGTVHGENNKIAVEETEIQKLGDQEADKSVEEQLDTAEKQRQFIERVEAFIDEASDWGVFEYHELRDKLMGLLFEAVNDSDLGTELVWNLLPQNVAFCANTAPNARDLGIFHKTQGILFRVNPAVAARLLALNPNMTRCLTWKQRGETVWMPAGVQQPDMADTSYFLGDHFIKVHGLERHMCILTGDEYQVVFSPNRQIDVDITKASFVIENEHGKKFGLHTFEEAMKLVYGYESFNKLYVPVMFNGKYHERNIKVIRHEDGYLRLECGCGHCETLIGTVAIGLKPRGTY